MTTPEKRLGRMKAVYSKALGSLGARIAELLGAARYAAVVDGVPAEMERLATTLPEIGRGNPFEGTIVTAAVLTAIGRTLMASGDDAEAAGEAMLEIAGLFYGSLPRLAKRGMRALFFSPLIVGRHERWSKRPESFRAAGDWKLRVQRDQDDCDVRIDFFECAILKWLTSIGSRELCPYLCATDHVSAREFGLNFRREGTLAGGADRCDCRYSRRAAP
jgi:hypothetical protein